MGKYSAVKDLDLEDKTHWYLVANRAGAVIYEGVPHYDFQFRERVHNPRAKLMETQLTSDRPGRGLKGSASGSRFGYGGRTTQHEHVAREFAGEIGRMLEAAMNDRRFADLVILAEPKFLGWIREELSPRVRARVRAAIPREFARGSDAELQRYLSRKLGANTGGEWAMSG